MVNVNDLTAQVEIDAQQIINKVGATLNHVLNCVFNSPFYLEPLTVKDYLKIDGDDDEDSHYYYFCPKEQALIPVCYLGGQEKLSYVFSDETTTGKMFYLKGDDVLYLLKPCPDLFSGLVTVTSIKKG